VANEKEMDDEAKAYFEELSAKALSEAERLKNLRDEIAEINQANRAYLRDPKYGSAVADNERRLQRLLEIVEESLPAKLLVMIARDECDDPLRETRAFRTRLSQKSLTDWKEL
jgi:hypothetical protein